MIKLRVNSSDQYLVYLISAFFIIGCTPLLTNVYLYIVLWIFFLPYLLLHLPAWINKHYALIGALLLFIIQILLYRIIGVSSASWGRYPGHLISFVPLFLMLQVYQGVSNKLKKRLFWIIVALMLFNIGDSIRLSILYPFLNIDSVRFYKDFVATINLGGSNFFNCTLVFSCGCFVVFLNTKRILLRFVMLSCVLLSGFYLIFFTSKASIVVYFILSILLITYAKFAKKQINFFIVLFLSLFIIFYIVEVYEEDIIRMIIELSPSSRLSSRLIALIDSDSEHASTSSIFARENYWMLSIRTWLSNTSNFLFGIGDHYTIDNPEKTGIGQHSDFFDTLARYGLIGSAFLFVALKNSFKYILSLFDKKLRLQIISILFIYLMCGFTKKVFIVEMSTMMFLYLPLLSYIIEKENKINRS